MHNVSAAVCAQPGMKQQTFVAECLTPWDAQSRRIHPGGGTWPALYGGEGGGHGYAALPDGAAENCLTPWDTQQARVFTDEGASPALTGADGGGGRNPAGLLFCPASGRDEPAPICEPQIAHALTSADSNGGRNPAGLVLCPEQSQSCAHSLACEPKLARTLTASGDASPCADRGQNVVAVSVPAVTMRMREGCDGGGKGPLLQKEKTAALATRGDQYLFAPPAVSVHQNGNGDMSVSDTAKSLTTIGTASCRNAPLVCAASGVTTKGNGDCFLTPECHGALSRGGGQAGQGYPAVLTAHPDVAGTLCASGAGLSRPAGMASEPDLCVAYALQENMLGRKEQNGPGGIGVNENVSFTLTECDIPAVASAIPIHDKATRCKGGGPTRSGDGCGNGLGVGKEGDPAPTLTSGDHHAVAAIPINTQIAARHKALGKGTGFGVGQGVAPAYTIQKSHSHAVAAVFNRQRSDFFKEQDIAGTQAARQCKDATDVVCCKETCFTQSSYGNLREGVGLLRANGGDNGGGSENLIVSADAPRYIVRRLTPTECERLQGFPDGWTQFGHDGQEISDTKRYQMLGNSVAVPCVKYILRGIAGVNQIREKN